MVKNIMIKNLYKFLLFTCVISNQIDCYISSLNVSLNSKNVNIRKKALVIGDWHVKNNFDMRDNIILKNFITKLNLTNKTICWIQEGNEVIYNIWKNDKDKLSFINLLCYQYENGLKLGRINFCPSDMRKANTRLFLDIVAFCKHEFNEELLNTYINCNRELLREYLLLSIKVKIDHTFIPVLISEIDVVLNLLNGVNNSIGLNYKQVFERAKKDLIIWGQNIINFKSTLQGCVITSSNANLGNILSIANDLSNMSDAGLYCNFLKNNSNYDAFVLFAGDTHIHKINSFLESLGYDSLYKKSEWSSSINEKKPLNQIDIDKIINMFLYL